MTFSFMNMMSLFSEWMKNFSEKKKKIFNKYFDYVMSLRLRKKGQISILHQAIRSWTLLRWRSVNQWTGFYLIETLIFFLKNSIFPWKWFMWRVIFMFSNDVINNSFIVSWVWSHVEQKSYNYDFKHWKFLLSVIKFIISKFVHTNFCLILVHGWL